MRCVGIIAEYNPFHRGHLRQIEYAREVLGADYIIVALSSYFTQRGTPALLTPRERAKMALSCGVDLVFQIPTLFSSAASLDYARAGVRLLASTGIVDTILCGCERADLPLIQRAAALELALTRDSSVSQDAKQLAQAMREGDSFVHASRQIIAQHLAEEFHPSLEEVMVFLSSPNNILAIDYQTALYEIDSSIQLALLPRDNDYHEGNLPHDPSQISSASAIRNHLKQSYASGSLMKTQNRADSEVNPSALTAIRPQLPAASFALLEDAIYQGRYLFPSDLDPVYAYLLSCDFLSQDILDLSPDLARRILAKANSFVSYQSFLEALSSKSFTKGRISRALCHLALDIHQADRTSLSSLGYIPYLQLLGMRSSAKPLLSAIARQGNKALLLRHADLKRILAQAPQEAASTARSAAIDQRAEELYLHLMQTRCKETLPRLAEQSLLKLK